MTTIDGAYVARRVATVWPALVFAALFAWLDWITHREVAFLVVLGFLVGGVVVFGPAIVAWLNLTATFARIPWWIKPFLFAAPAYIYLLSRGQGTTSAGAPIVITGLLLMAALLVVGPSLDARLAPYYQARNRLIPKPLRIVLSPVIAILLSFLIVHGDLSSLPAFWGGATQTRKRAIETDTSLFVFAALLSMVVTLLLLREVQTRRLNVALAPHEPGVRRGLMASPEPRWLVPEGGMRAWTAPDVHAPPIATLGARTELVVMERAGAWARVRGANGWIGWVDGRALVSSPLPWPSPVPVAPAGGATRQAPGARPMPTAPPAPGMPTAAPAAASPVERARVPAAGTRAWPAPDPTAAPAMQLAPGLELEVVQRRGAWAHVRASNGWTGWVDGRVLDSGSTGGTS